MQARRGRCCSLQSDISRNRHYRNAAARHRGLHCQFQDARHLFGMRHQFAIMAALCEKMLGMSFLKISAADFSAGDLRRNGEDRNAAAMTIVETIDQVQVAWTTAPCADGQFPCEVRFCAGSKRCRLFVPHVNPPNLFLPANCVGKSVE